MREHLEEIWFNLKVQQTPKVKVKAQHKNQQKAAGKLVRLHLILTNAEGSAAKTEGNSGEGDHKNDPVSELYRRK